MSSQAKGRVQRADPAAVGVYLIERVEDGLTAATLKPGLLGHPRGAPHRRTATPPHRRPHRPPRPRRAARRTYGIAPRRQARALSVEELGQILARIDRTSPTGARDAAILLLGYAGALRRSDLAGLHHADIESQPTGLLVTIRRSKTDQEHRGQVIGIAHGR